MVGFDSLADLDDSIAHADIHCWSQTHCEWGIAREPVHSQPTATMHTFGPMLVAASEWQLKARRRRAIGLVPCAVAGSTIDEWILSEQLVFEPESKHIRNGGRCLQMMLSATREALNAAPDGSSIAALVW